MKDNRWHGLILTFATVTACTPALHLHEGDQFQIPYTGSAEPPMTDFNSLSPSQKVVVQRCGDTARDYHDMQNVKPLFDRLIQDAEKQSGATLLKDVVITVKQSKCVELEAIPLLVRKN